MMYADEYEGYQTTSTCSFFASKLESTASSPSGLMIISALINTGTLTLGTLTLPVIGGGTLAAALPAMATLAAYATVCGGLTLPVFVLIVMAYKKYSKESYEKHTLLSLALINIVLTAISLALIAGTPLLPVLAAYTVGGILAAVGIGILVCLATCLKACQNKSERSAADLFDPNNPDSPEELDLMVRF